MLNKLKLYTISFAVVFITGLFISQSSYAQPYACFPTCNNDARFFVFAGSGQSTFIDTRYVFGISSPGDSENLEIGVFDGDDATSQGGMTSNWDQGGVANIRLTLYADPMGLGDQTMFLGEWSGDGSFGNNMGFPMPNNDWVDFTISNAEQARSENGRFRYTLVVDTTSLGANAQNQYKIRTDGTMIILPFQAFAFMSYLLKWEISLPCGRILFFQMI